MIKISKSIDGQYFFVVFAKNGQKLVTSETYTRKEKAVQSAKALIELLKPNIEILVDVNIARAKGKKRQVLTVND